MSEKTFRLYGYRWVVLGVFMFVNVTIQTLWIAYAPITGPAAQFYGVDDLQIGLLAMTFMIVFIPLSIPVSWAIDTYGFHKAVGFGAIISTMMKRGIKPYDLMEKFKQEPSVEPFLRDGVVKEYQAHMIPEAGYGGMPALYSDLAGGLVASKPMYPCRPSAFAATRITPLASATPSLSWRFIPKRMRPSSRAPMPRSWAIRPSLCPN